MITIADATGQTLTIDDAELTCAEVGRRFEDFCDKQRHVPEFTISIAHMDADPFARVHRPAPTSARWEGPPPRKARR